MHHLEHNSCNTQLLLTNAIQRTGFKSRFSSAGPPAIRLTWLGCSLPNGYLGNWIHGIVVQFPASSKALHDDLAPLSVSLPRPHPQPPSLLDYPKALFHCLQSPLLQFFSPLPLEPLFLNSRNAAHATLSQVS